MTIQLCSIEVLGARYNQLFQVF